MRVIKPQRLGILHRVVEHERRHTLVVSVLVYAPLAEPRRLGSEQAMWMDLGGELSGGILDESFPKPRGEILVTGKAFAPSGTARAVMTGLAVERDDRPLVDKKLAAIGDRYWKGEKPTEPVPFSEMPLDYAHAFGGEGFADNPIGKGVAPVETELGLIQPLPNVEDPRRLVAAPGDRPAPAGYGPLDVTWQERFSKVGKAYGGDWLETRFPGPARDFDAHFYNAAPADQQIDGFWRGDERLVVEGMHPSRPTVETRLEPLAVKVFATQRRDGGETFVALSARLDTLHVFPHRERLVSIYRATMPVQEDDADDVVHLMIAAEDFAAPRPVDHYQRVLALRLDKDKGAILALKDEDLMPPKETGWEATIDLGEIGEAARLEHRTLARAAKGRARKLAEGEARMKAAGFDVSFAEPEMPPLPDPYDADALLETARIMQERADEAKAEAEARRDEMEVRARQAFAEMGQDWDALREQAAMGRGGPPAFSADEHLAMLHDMARISQEGGRPLEDLERDLTDPRFEEMLQTLERQLREAHLKFAHFLPAAGPLDEAERQRLRVLVTAAKDAGEPMRNRRLVGADLHGLDLRGMDLSGALLEGADLSGADLSEANLTEAVLTRARLAETRLSGADLTSANLGDVRLEATDLSGALLDETVLMKSVLAGTLLVGARLRGTTFFQVEVIEADLSHVEAEKPIFMQTDLRRLSFVGARMQQPCFLECDIRGVDFTGAELFKAVFAKVEAEGACFAAAQLPGAAIVYGSRFDRTVFSSASLEGANAYDVSFVESQLESAVLDRANLSRCDLSGTNLRRARARHALLVRTRLDRANLRGADLLGAILQKASLLGADLTGANLSRADLSLVRTDGATRVTDALMLDTRIEPRHR